MRIVQLTPGSGDQFYCENCLRDAALVRALRAAGAEVVLVPMYLPLSLDSAAPLERTEVFFGGVNVYLQQKLGFFRRTPRWLDKLFDADWLLRKVSQKAGMTSARQLGEMTLSMLKGPRGRQAKEVDRLVEFLESPENKPDVLILSNLLLAGLAGPVKERLGCKLVCWLQDEDGFVDGLGDPWSRRVWDKMAHLVPLFDLFLPVSRYFADAMQKRLPIADEKLYVCPPGIDLSKYEPAAAPPEVPTIGFLGRMSENNGFAVMGQVFVWLVNQEGLEESKLLICGGMTSADKNLVEDVLLAFRYGGCTDSYGKFTEEVKFWEDFDWNARRDFLRRLTVLCSPSRQNPAYAMNVLEAMACGVPFAAPRAGVYPEWAELTRGGVLYEPNTPDELQKTLHSLLTDSAKIKELGENGRRAMPEHFDIRKNAGRLKERFEQFIKS